jgi:hypothetical protein
MKKIILFVLGGLIAFFIFRFFVIELNNYTKTNECNSSLFVANGGRIYLHFININKVKSNNVFSFIIIGKNGKKREINYVRDKALSTFYIDDKILKDDTLMIKKIDSKTIKIYDFENEAKCIKAGKRRGDYYCTLLYKDNFHSENYYQDDSESINYISIDLN